MHPTWLFHATEKARIFTDEAEMKQALADGWADTPAAFPDSTEKEELTAQAIELGIQVDKRWGVDRLRKEITAVQQ